MRRLLLKGSIVFAVLFVFLGVLPLGQSTASASNTDLQVVEQGTTGSGVEHSILEDVYGDHDIQLFDETGPTYPGTNVPMRVGDVLYSTKTLGGSTQIVGHVGIVNSNFQIVHVTPSEDGGVIDSLSAYRGRHGSGETIRVYRPRDGYGAGAARWATNNYSRVTDYFINPVALYGQISPNYCSKFIWQAFYYGEGRDLYNDNSGNPNKIGLITPIAVINSNKLVYQTQFKA